MGCIILNWSCAILGGMETTAGGGRDGGTKGKMEGEGGMKGRKEEGEEGWREEGGRKGRREEGRKTEERGRGRWGGTEDG